MHVGRKFNFLWVQGIHKTFPVQLPLRMEVSREGEAVQLPWLLCQVAFIMAAPETIILSGGNCDCNVHFPRKPHIHLCVDSLEALHGKHKAQLIGRENFVLIQLHFLCPARHVYLFSLAVSASASHILLLWLVF